MTSANDPRDQRVSDTYRELGAETAPEDLNRRILDMAARGSTARVKPLVPVWMKPAAWTAMIGLSLAIVLELGQFPETPVPAENSPVATPAEAPADSLQQAESKREMDAALAVQQAAESDSTLRSNDLSKQKSLSEPAPSAPALPRARSESAATERLVVEQEPEPQLLEERRLEDFSQAPRNEVGIVAAPAQRSLLTPESTQADEVIIEGFADLPAAQKEQAGASQGIISVEQRDGDHCTYEQRATRKTWLQCIQLLRDGGEEEAAAAELEAFMRKFNSNIQGPATE